MVRQYWCLACSCCHPFGPRIKYSPSAGQYGSPFRMASNMIYQQVAIDASKGQSSFTAEAPFPAWRIRLQSLVVCVGAGFLSIILGPDNYWDLRYYHLYAPWAYLHD